MTSSTPTNEGLSARLREHAKRMSDALIKVRPLGGSELFVRIGDEYFADPDFCGREIERLKSDLHDARIAIVNLERHLDNGEGP